MRRRRTWISRYPIRDLSRPPCERCGQPSEPGLKVCAQCERDDRHEAMSHAAKGER